MEGILYGVAVVAMLIGAFGYNSLRRKWAGIIGVGGSYLILIGVMLLVAAIGTLIRVIGGGSAGANGVEIVTSIIFLLICLAYTVYVMITRCTTVMQRIMLPIVAVLIGFGFCWRFLAALIFHIPMESGKVEVKFPAVIYDPNGDEYRMQSESGDHADYYCQKTGQSVQLWESDIEDGLPNGWR
ncbi:MAG: hypothetical protein IJZ85_04835 [Lachnospiraceae bacterium]|nr:hypothetical protein [Lachnospiraceae bacterium]